VLRSLLIELAELDEEFVDPEDAGVESIGLKPRELITFI
jgi:hypothetical protein